MSSLICKYCGSERKNKNSLTNHEIRCKLNPNRIVQKNGGTKGLIPWNKGLTKNSSPSIRRAAEKKKEYKGEKNSFYGKKHTIETKKKISESRKEFIKNNPHMSPWVYSHYTKRRSYAERYWKKILVKYGIFFEEQYQYSIYCLDFAILDSKIDLEIDGEQHYKDPRIVESDKKRDQYFKNLGWKVIRIRWSEYKSLTKDDKIKFVTNLIESLKSSVAV